MPSYGTFINLHEFAPDEWERQLDAASELHELDHLELWLEFIPERHQLATMADLFGGWRTVMHGPFIGLSLATEWEDLARLSVDRCLRAIEVAGYLHCELVTFHAGVVQRDEPQDRTLERLATRMDGLRRSSSPVVTMENMSARGGATREAVSSLADVNCLAEMVPGLAWTFDVGHCWQNGEDPVAALGSPLSESIALVHLHDAREGGKGHLRLGAGTMNYKSVIQACEEIPHDLFVSLETIGADDTASSWTTVRDQVAVTA